MTDPTTIASFLAFTLLVVAWIFLPSSKQAKKTLATSKSN